MVPNRRCPFPNSVVLFQDEVSSISNSSSEESRVAEPFFSKGCNGFYETRSSDGIPRDAVRRKQRLGRLFWNSWICQQSAAESNLRGPGGKKKSDSSLLPTVFI